MPFTYHFAALGFPFYPYFIENIIFCIIVYPILLQIKSSPTILN